MNPAQYDAWYDSPLGAACLESELALLRRGAGELAGKDILEVGCGTGRFLFALARETARAVGVDRDLAMLDFARQHAPPASQHRFVWVEGDATAIPIADESFDVVFENTLFCFCKDPVPVMREMVRLCRAGGKVLCGELNPFAPWQWWRRLKALVGIGSFRGASWHPPRNIVATLVASGCQAEWFGRSIFSPPLNVGNVLKWRSAAEKLGQKLWPCAGAYYVVGGTKARKI